MAPQSDLRGLGQALVLLVGCNQGFLNLTWVGNNLEAPKKGALFMNRRAPINLMNRDKLLCRRGEGSGVGTG